MRLFVAIRPPAPIRDQLLAVMGGIGGARWQDNGQLHLTLRFIGDVDRHLGADIHAALLGLIHPRFTIALNGIGPFGNRGRPNTIWAGVTPAGPLRALHNKVDRSLASVGLAPEHRAFHPHVTLARLGRGAGPVDDLVANTRLSTHPFEVRAIGLFESRLTPERAVYTELESYPLAPASISDISRSTSAA